MHVRLKVNSEETASKRCLDSEESEEREETASKRCLDSEESEEREETASKRCLDSEESEEREETASKWRLDSEESEESDYQPSGTKCSTRSQTLPRPACSDPSFPARPLHSRRCDWLCRCLIGWTTADVIGINIVGVSGVIGYVGVSCLAGECGKDWRTRE
jgi:hypothetical protein